MSEAVQKDPRVSLPAFDYQEPRTAEEAIALLGEYGDDAILMAGGLTVMLLLRERLIQPRVVISLSSIDALNGVGVNGDCRIGAMTSHSEIVASRVLRESVPLLCDACGRVGSPAIRNMGTLGGSVSQGDGASDTAPALLALDAEAVAVGPDGERRIPLSGFFQDVFTTALLDQEILISLHVPKPAEGTRTRFFKYTCTSAEAFAAVTVAIALVPSEDGSCKDIRIGLGSVAPTPIRATQAEDLLRGQKATPELIAEVAAAAAAATDPPSDGQGSADYRREMTRVWVRRLLEETVIN